MAKYDWLTEKHPVWSQQEKRWQRQELLLTGSNEVVDAELAKFDWETQTGPAYVARKAQATYINFPDLFATAMMGHLLNAAPTPDSGLSFGTLGDVARERADTPTQAELVYYNTDGVGIDGSQWDNFWLTSLKNAMGTGHRWIYVDATEEAPGTRADEIAGLRPYIVEYSPLSVINWEFDRGELLFAVLELFERNVSVDSTDAMIGNEPERVYLLFTKAGFNSLGSEFSMGGWWKFNGEKEITSSLQGWESTEGRIPFFPLYYERAKSLKDCPRISRGAIDSIGNTAVSYMNIASAADFDAWDAAMSLQYFVGVDDTAFNIAMQKLKDGSKYIPVATNMETGRDPKIIDSSVGAVASDVFESRLKEKWRQARHLALIEATSAPESSGISKQLGFLEIKAPRLILLASELENAQNTAIHFLEQRFGNTRPEGFVTWTRDFDLESLTKEIEQHFTLETLANMDSPTARAAALTANAIKTGIVTTDADVKKVETEYQESAAKARERLEAPAVAAVDNNATEE